MLYQFRLTTDNWEIKDTYLKALKTLEEFPLKMICSYKKMKLDKGETIIFIHECNSCK